MRLCICECYGPFLLDSGSQRSRLPKRRTPGQGRHVRTRRASAEFKVSGLMRGGRVSAAARCPLTGTETKAATLCLPGWPWGGSPANREPPACKQLGATVTKNSRYAHLYRKGGDEKREDVRPLPAAHSPCGQAVNPGRAVPPAGLPR